jgi:hypothetical protein
MIVVNFSHPLTLEQCAQIERLSGRHVDRVIDVPTRFDADLPFAPSVARLVEASGLSSREWQTLPLLVNLPAFSPIAALLLARLHGLIGHFPTVLRLRPAPGSSPPTFEVAELLDLQSVRDDGRRAR